MTVTIVDEARAVTGGVDTHADAHVAAALDPIGGLLGVEEFPATAPGYARLVAWLRGFGTVGLAGIEGTGSYGAGLARHICAAGGPGGGGGPVGPAGPAAGGQDPVRWMRSAPRGRPCRAAPWEHLGDVMARSRRSGR